MPKTETKPRRTESEAISRLQSHGFTVTGGWITPPPNWDSRNDPDDCEGAVDFLLADWDYAYNPGPGALIS